MKTTDTLLMEREIRGLRWSLGFRILFVSGIFVVTISLTDNMFQSLSIGGLAAISLVISSYFLRLLGHRQHLKLVGIGGALIDIVMLACLPITWYIGLGGAAHVPAAYMTKSSTFTLLCLGMLILNSITMRPLYPLIVTAGSVCIHAGLLLYALQDPRTVISPDPQSHVLGQTIKLEFIWITFLMLISSGVGLAILSAVSRRTIHEAVALEKTNVQASRYFSPNVFATISTAEDSFFTASGKLQPVAVLFSDLRDFTALSETLAPQDVLALLSTYHRAMVEIIFQHGGTLDKFIGDGIMATFGTPVAHANDAEQAVRAGIAMQQALDQINREREQAGATPLRQGIGIHYGPAIVGNIGTEQRLEYTVIGDTVNVASRLEGACKQHGVAFLISATVEQALPADIRRAPLATIALRGKQEPIAVFVVDHAPPDLPLSLQATQALPS